MLALQMNALFVITDSGGLQVETTVLGVPCLTVMDHPVWLITHKEGTNTLVGSDCSRLEKEADKIRKSKPESKSKSKSSVPRWDGQTAERIITIISTQ